MKMDPSSLSATAEADEEIDDDEADEEIEDDEADDDDFFPEALEETSQPVDAAAARVAATLAAERQAEEDARNERARKEEAARTARLRHEAEREERHRRLVVAKRTPERESFYDTLALQAWMRADYASGAAPAQRLTALNRTVVRCLGDATGACSKNHAIRGTTDLFCRYSTHQNVHPHLRAPSALVNQLSTAYVHLSYLRDGHVTAGLYGPRLTALRARGMIFLPEARDLLHVLQLLESHLGLGTIRFARRVLEQLFYVEVPVGEAASSSQR